MLIDGYPEKYWHCFVQREGEKDFSILSDLRYEELFVNVVEPWRAGRAFVVAGTVIASPKQVRSIRILHTRRHEGYYADSSDGGAGLSRTADLVANRDVLLSKGTDFTFELLFSGSESTAPEPDVALIERLCRRLPQAARILGNRSRKGKLPYEVKDEYDVQDLLHALIRGYVKYSVQEDPLPKVAGAKSGRADISIEELGVLIELKYVHGPEDQKRLFEEYSQDLVLYAQWAPLKTLIYLVYNSADLRDPEAFEKLASEQEINGKRFAVKMVLA
ncbi:hypothetical protein [Pseudomonas sp. Irchel 3A18]|uniref:PD-(D/E)XK nuclease domain-containing protein n=2 Tax=Pseudomonas TaxID=286 RepID=UPI00117B7E07|nr:hypothetical protein [Pseudomonas sp. Irchel 3A18]